MDFQGIGGLDLLMSWVVSVEPMMSSGFKKVEPLYYFREESFGIAIATSTINGKLNGSASLSVAYKLGTNINHYLMVKQVFLNLLTS